MAGGLWAGGGGAVAVVLVRSRVGVGGVGLGGHHQIYGVFADVRGDEDLTGDVAEGEDLFAVDDLIDLDFLAVEGVFHDSA